ncbi:hypothetical protein [Streptomyces sp. NPDC002845]
MGIRTLRRRTATVADTLVSAVSALSALFRRVPVCAADASTPRIPADTALRRSPRDLGHPDEGYASAFSRTTARF